MLVAVEKLYKLILYFEIITLKNNSNNTKTKDLINFMKKLIIETLYNELFVKYLSAAKSIG